MDNMKVGGGLGIIKKITLSGNDKKVSQNPFASNPFGISFKGKVLTGDLFEKTATEASKNTILQKGKMAVSAAIASLVEIRSTIAEKIKPILNFAKQTTKHIANLANKISDFKPENIKLSLKKTTETKAPPISRAAQKLLVHSPEKLEKMWQELEKQAV